MSNMFRAGYYAPPEYPPCCSQCQCTVNREEDLNEEENCERCADKLAASRAEDKEE